MSHLNTYMLKFILGLGLASLPQLIQAKTSLVEAQNHLSKMDEALSKLNHDLSQNSSQKASLSQTLQANEKKIMANQVKTLDIEQKIKTLRLQIQALRDEMQSSQHKIERLKPSIQDHLNLHVRLANQSLWQLALAAKNPFEYQEELDLIRYLHETEQEQLKRLKLANEELKQTKLSFIQQKKSLKDCELRLIKENQTMLAVNERHQKTIHELQAKMKSQTQALVLLKKDQANLKNLIQQLLKESTLQSHKPFSSLKQNLNTPIYQILPQALNLGHGLLFPAPLNSAIYAVSTGKIVFSDWLNGYGYLIILDHGWGFMSLYANNSQLLKHKGELVKQGELIAKSGESGSFKKQGLYFEIRQRSKVISARTWFKTHMG